MQKNIPWCLKDNKIKTDAMEQNPEVSNKCFSSQFFFFILLQQYENKITLSTKCHRSLQNKNDKITQQLQIHRFLITSAPQVPPLIHITNKTGRTRQQYREVQLLHMEPKQFQCAAKRRNPKSCQWQL